MAPATDGHDSADYWLGNYGDGEPAGAGDALAQRPDNGYHTLLAAGDPGVLAGSAVVRATDAPG